MNKRTQTFIFVVAMMLSLTLGLSAAFGQDSESKQDRDSSERGRNSIVGTWMATVTIRNCATGLPIISVPVLNTFDRGGTMMETSQSLATRSAGHGIWKRTRGHEYISVFLFRRVNADGTNNGSQKVRRTHVLDGDTLTTEATFEIFDPNGVLVSTGCATETATRLEFD